MPLDSKSKGLGFDFYCWSYVEVLGKLIIPCCICPPSRGGGTEKNELLGLAITIAAENALNSPQR